MPDQQQHNHPKPKAWYLYERLKHVPLCFFWAWLFFFVIPVDIDTNADWEWLQRGSTLLALLVFLLFIAYTTGSRTVSRSLIWIILAFVACQWYVFQEFVEKKLASLLDITLFDVDTKLRAVKVTLNLFFASWRFLCGVALFALNTAAPHLTPSDPSEPCAHVSLNNTFLAWSANEDRTSRLNCLLPCLSKIDWLLPNKERFLDFLCWPISNHRCQLSHSAVNNFAPLCAMLLILHALARLVMSNMENNFWDVVAAIAMPYFASRGLAFAVLCFLFKQIKEGKFVRFVAKVWLVIFLVSLTGGRENKRPFSGNYMLEPGHKKIGVFLLGMRVNDNPWILYSLYALDCGGVLLLGSIKKDLGPCFFNLCMCVIAATNVSTVKYLVMLRCCEEIHFCLNQMLCPWYRLVNDVASVEDKYWQDGTAFGSISSPRCTMLPLDALVFGTLVVRHGMENMADAFGATCFMVELIQDFGPIIEQQRRRWDRPTTKTICEQILTNVALRRGYSEKKKQFIEKLMRSMLARGLAFSFQGELPLACMEANELQAKPPPERRELDCSAAREEAPTPLHTWVLGVLGKSDGNVDGYGLHLRREKAAGSEVNAPAANAPAAANANLQADGGARPSRRQAAISNAPAAANANLQADGGALPSRRQAANPPSDTRAQGNQQATQQKRAQSRPTNNHQHRAGGSAVGGQAARAVKRGADGQLGGQQKRNRT